MTLNAPMHERHAHQSWHNQRHVYTIRVMTNDEKINMQQYTKSSCDRVQWRPLKRIVKWKADKEEAAPNGYTTFAPNSNFAPEKDIATNALKFYCQYANWHHAKRTPIPAQWTPIRKVCAVTTVPLPLINSQSWIVLEICATLLNRTRRKRILSI